MVSRKDRQMKDFLREMAQREDYLRTIEARNRYELIRKKKQFTQITLSLIAGLLTLVISFFAASPLSFIIQKDQVTNIDSQIESLNNVEESLDQLKTFVNDQKKSIIESQKTLKDLRIEQEQLQTAVNTDKETIDSIFQLQEKRLQDRVWIERGIGFFIGVLSSLVAAFIYGLFQRKNKLEANKNG